MKEENENACEAVQKYSKAMITRCWVRKLKKECGFYNKN